MPTDPLPVEHSAQTQTYYGVSPTHATIQQLPESPAKVDIPGNEVLGELGHGGMGIVYKARQVSANRLVALKMILKSKLHSLEDKVRFRMEVEAIGRLAHPHIVQLHEVGEYEGSPFFSLEFCDGGSLYQALKTWEPSVAEAVALTETLARAIHFAHLRGVVHRDLKPANILLASGGHKPSESASSSGGLNPPFAIPKISDFGLAKRLDNESNVSHTGVVMGTPSYMAPEQAAGKVHDTGPAADVYALGVILYELLCGRPPFKGATAFETIQQVLSSEPVPPSRWRAEIPRDLETICLKCLQKDPGKRYDSADDLADDLRRYQQGEPIAARPVGRIERVYKWVKRRPAAALTLGAFAALIAVVIFSLVLVTEKLHEIQAAERARVQATVNRLLDAAPASVPQILSDLESVRQEVLPRLLEEWDENQGQRRRRAALALLPVKPEKVRGELLEALFETEDPEEMLLIRDRLSSQAESLTDDLWKRVEKPSVRFRALVALARFDPQSNQWELHANEVVRQMLTEKSSTYGHGSRR